MFTENSQLENKTILVAGGDLRQISLAGLFSKHNNVYCIGLEQSSGIGTMKTTLDEMILAGIRADYIIFPMPASIDNNTVNTPFSHKQLLIDDVLSMAKPTAYIYGGKLTDVMIDHLLEKKLQFVDYLECEELAVLNAVPTAEGALQIAMEELATTVYQTNFLIVGFGRISKVLAHRLSALGGNVTISARNYKDLAWIEVSGYKAVHTRDIKRVIGKQDVVFNTVPATVLTEEELTLVSDDCLLVDLASKPGGIDFATANRLGIKTIWALSLPGKVAPVSAGKIIYNTIQNIERERRFINESD